MSEILVSVITTIMGAVIGTAIGLGIAYFAASFFGWDFKKIFTPKLILTVLGTIIALNVIQYILKSFGVSDKVLMLLYAALAFFGFAFISVFRKKNNQHDT